MAILWFDSFDWYTSLASRYDEIGTTGTSGSTQISQGVGGRATAGLAVAQGAGGIGPQEWNMYILKNLVPTTNHVTIGGRQKLNTNANNPITILGLRSAGGVRQLELWVTTGVSTYDLQLRRAGTVLATATAAIFDATFQFIELDATLADSGTAIVYVDGIEVINFSGDTLNGGTGVCTDFYWGNPYGENTSYNFVWDDIYVNEGVRLGDVQVSVLRPESAGSETDWSPLSGSNWQNVDDTTVHDSDTTYNRTEPSGNKDLFNLPALGLTGLVYGVKQHVVARKEASGEKTLDLIIKSGSTESIQTVALTETYVVHSRTLLLDPDGSVAWDVDAIDALEAGYGIP